MLWSLKVTSEQSTRVGKQTGKMNLLEIWTQSPALRRNSFFLPTQFVLLNIAKKQQQFSVWMFQLKWKTSRGFRRAGTRNLAPSHKKCCFLPYSTSMVKVEPRAMEINANSWQCMSAIKCSVEQIVFLMPCHLENHVATPRSKRRHQRRQMKQH